MSYKYDTVCFLLTFNFIVLHVILIKSVSDASLTAIHQTSINVHQLSELGYKLSLFRINFGTLLRHFGHKIVAAMFKCC